MSVVTAMIRKLAPNVEAARDERLARLAEVEAEAPIPIPDPECGPCKAARLAHAAALREAEARARQRDRLLAEVQQTKPGAIIKLEKWLMDKLDEIRSRRPEVKTERRASGSLVRVWTDAGWLLATAESIHAARREAQALTFVPSDELPAKLAEIRARVQQQLDLGEDDARFQEMSARAITLTGRH